MVATRRGFLHQAGACAAGATLASVACAAPPESRPTQRTKPTLIAVYLRGGADPLGTIVPYADANLARWRPNLALPGPGGAGPNRVLPADGTFGFNPNMAALHAMYERGHCAPIVCVGSPHGTRSHFDAQDFMERGAPGEKLISTGWLNRYLEATKSKSDANLRAISLQPLLPRSMRGKYSVLAKPDQKAELALSTYAKLYPGEMPRKTFGRSDPLGAQTRGAIQQFGARTIEQLRELQEVLDKSPAATVKYPNSEFSRQLADLAKVVKANRGLEVTALDYGGWDHHINEGPATGQLGRMLGDVSESLRAFYEDLDAAGNRVCVLVMSEFGRTVKENGNQGTDHGHGGFMLAIGAGVCGKKVYGTWNGLDENQLYESRDLPVHTDFRVVFAEVLEGLFGFDGIREGLFPEYSAKSPPLGLMQSA
ncbi:MAG: hypothetical protein DCC68_08075 [Planctomycetota bacterium]|nr:MAG: hypothetical protein DCC68_08075 [Planctomycetota bacterium]